MDKIEAQLKVDQVVKTIQEKKIIFNRLHEELECIANEVNDLRSDVLDELDDSFDWDEYRAFSIQMNADWLPSSYSC